MYYENECGLTQKPREKLFSTPAEKKTLSARHSLNTARIAPRLLPHANSLAFAQTARVRRYTIENRRRIHNYNYTYVYLVKNIEM